MIVVCGPETLALVTRTCYLLGGFAAAFLFAQFISVGGYFFHLEWGYVIAFLFFIAAMFVRPQGLFGAKS